MEKIFKYFPKAAQAAVSFQNPTFNPARDKRLDANDYKHRAHLARNFSSPIGTMIPIEARGTSKSFETQEPTSPKVSCMGQIKHKNKNKLSKQKLKPDSHTKPEKIRPTGPKPQLKRQQSTIKKIFASRRKSDASMDHGKPPLPHDGAPRLSQMRRYASSRETLASFDWTIAQIAPTDDSDDDEERDCSEGVDDVIIPFSAPILMTRAGDEAGLGLEPRREINLWKRRTMAQPKPLQVNMGRHDKKGNM